MEFLSLTIVLRNKVDLNTSKGGDTLINRLLRDTGRDVTPGASGCSGGDCSAGQSGAGSKELASSNAENDSERRSRAVLDERCEANGTGGGGSGGTHDEYDELKICRFWKKGLILELLC